MKTGRPKLTKTQIKNRTVTYLTDEVLRKIEHDIEIGEAETISQRISQIVRRYYIAEEQKHINKDSK